ncbi:hypothetical protein [Psychromonas hadalis]|uniref:hypothetical protein n=1 Tax=Psychromonas hadalis TaxID=211669 RepID=UPI0003B77482|nr:hypothetical protein [Psychromonas hadalis]
MKMKLSVVLGMIDKISAPTKGIVSQFDRYNKQIKAVKSKLKDSSDAMAMISQQKKMQKNLTLTNAKYSATQEKLDKIRAKIKKAGAPTAALTLAFKQQQLSLQKLQQEQSGYRDELGKNGRALKKAGINTKKLGSENVRLSREHDKNGASLVKMTKRYSRLQKVLGPLNKLHRSIRMPTFGQMKGAGMGLLGIGATVGGFMSIINRTAGEMDKLGKTAANLKMPVADLQAMQSQAEHAGVSAETMSGSLIRFTKRLGVLQTTGSGALGSFLKQGKNPVFRELKKAKTTEEAYRHLLDSFSKLTSQQEKMAFADAAFGDSGRRMLIMLEEGTAGLDNAKKELKEMGAITPEEDIKQAEAYNDAMQRIGEVFKGLQFQALTPVMKELTGLMGSFTDKMKNADYKEAILEKVKEVIKGIFTGIKYLGKALYFVSQNLPELLAGLALFKIALIAINALLVMNPIGLIIAGIAALTVGIVYLLAKTGFLMPVLEGLWELFKRIGAIVGAVASAIASFFIMIGKSILSLMDLIPDALLPDSWIDGIKSAQSGLDELGDSVANFGDKSANYAVNGEFKETHLKAEIVRRKIEDAQPAPQTYHGRGKSLASTQTMGYGGYGGMLRNQATQSKSLVEVRIKSDKPVEIANVQSDKHTDMMIDTGDLLGDGF